MSVTRSTRIAGRSTATRRPPSAASRTVEENPHNGSGGGSAARRREQTTVPADVWSEDPAAPALRCLQRNLVSVTGSARDILVLLAVCTMPPAAGERSATAIASLDEAVDAAHEFVEAANRAAAALDRALTAPW